MAEEREGVLKFRVEQQSRLWTLPEPAIAAELIAWRQLYVKLALIGQDSARYQGLGFGNVSARVPPWGAAKGARRFLITGSQTGHLDFVRPEHLALVERYALRDNWLASVGPTAPSSESLSHAAFYELGAHLRWVAHVHCPVLWQAAQRRLICLPCASASAAYGSTALVDEIERLWRDGSLAETGIMAMNGHEDGLIACGSSAVEVASRLTEKLALALRLECESNGGLGRT